MTEPLHIGTFGGLWVRRGETDVPHLGSSTTAAALVYVASHGRPVQRTLLADLLWPDRSESEARTNLRSILHRLRTELGSDVVATRQTVGLAAGVRFDAAEFEEHMRHGRLREAWELYSGEFLAGFLLDASAEFDSWLVGEQVRFRSMVVEVGQRLLVEEMATGEPSEATEIARRLLDLDPTHEHAVRSLMWLLAAQGRRTAAIETFEAFRRRLTDEYGAQPDAATVQVLQEISRGVETRSHQPFPSEAVVAGAGAREPATPAAAGSTRVTTYRHATSFVGRTRELTELRELITGSGARLVTLHGPGGIGKTRLALRLMDEPAEQFEVRSFVPLEDVASPSEVLLRIAAALDTELVPGDDAVAQLVRILQHRRVLLVMDNVEHLRPLPLTRLLRECPQLTLVVTSRERLDVSEERLFSVEGLELPAENGPTLELASAASVALFIDRARQVDPAFEPSDDEIAAIATLCGLVEGSPLAIELAAALTRVMSCAALVEEVARSLDVLSRRPGIADDRHVSMRATFESSWARLSESERRAFAGLGVFEGGFRREAAAAICGISVTVLSALVDKSLVRVSPEKRFDLHPLARQIARERLAERSADLAATRERHGRWYLRFAREREEGLWMRDRRAVLAVIGPELANLRAAWRWALSTPDLEEIVASAWAFDSIYQHHVRQAHAVFSEAAAALDEHDPAHHRALGHVLVYLAHFERFETGGDIRGVIERALALLRPLEDDIGVMRALVRLGFSQLVAGQRHEGRETWREGLALARRHGTARDRGVFLTILAGLEVEGLSLERAEAHFSNVFDEMTAFGTEVHLVHVKRDAAWYFLHHGDLARADTLFEEAITLARRLGDRRLEPHGYVIRRALNAGDHGLAEEAARDAVAVYQVDGNRREELGAVISLAHVLIARAKYAEARSTGELALRVAWEISDDEGAVGALLALSEAATALERPLAAARYLGVIRSLTGQTGDTGLVDGMMTQVRDILGDQAFNSEVESGERGGLSELLARPVDVDRV